MCRTVLASLLVWALSSAGHAQATPDKRPAAHGATSAAQSQQALLRAALEAYGRGELDTAYELLQTAHENAPSARTLRGLGIVAFRRGRYQEALSLLEQSLVHPKMPLGAQLSAGARELIAECKTHLGSVRLEVAPSDAELWVDGQPTAYTSGTPLTLAVGGHELLLRRAGFEERTLNVAVAAASELPLNVQLDALPLPAASEDKVSALAHPAATHALVRDESPALRLDEPGRDTKRRRLWRVGVTTGVLGLTAVALGVVGALMGKQRVAEVERECRALQAKVCTPQQADRKEDQAHLARLSRLAIGGFVSGGTLLATSLGVLLALPANPSEHRAWGVSLVGRF